MMSVSANTAAIRITQLRAAITAMTTARGRLGASGLVSSLEDEIDFLEKQIEADLQEGTPSEESIAQPIAPNI